jgi:DNA-binding LacI/PurR family transcriptional regulator
LTAAGLDPDTVSTIHGDYMLESGHVAAATLLAANDLMAIGCIQHASLVEAVAA